MGFLSLAALALRYPKLFKFLKRFGKWIALALVVLGAIWAFNVWKNNLIENADAAGFERARAAYQAAVEAANEREQATQVRLDQMSIAFGGLAGVREQEITLTLKPQFERIEREVASDPRYRCAASDGVLEDVNAGRAAVDSSIAASNP